MTSSPENPKSTKSFDASLLRLLLPALILFIVLGSMIASGIIYLVGFMTDTDIQSLLGKQTTSLTSHELLLFRVIVGLNHLFSFLVPSVLFAWIFWKSRAWKFLGLNKLPTNRVNLVATIWLLSAFPIGYALYWLNQQIPLPSWMDSMETQAKGMLEQLLVIQNIPDLIISLIVMAVLPALGEELVFRGLLQNLLERAWEKPLLAILLSAFIFSAIHLQFEGFLPRFFLGILLGYLFFLTKNLWVPITAHFFYNGIQVIAFYLQGANTDLLSTDQIEQSPGWWMIPACLVFLGITWLLHKLISHARPA